MYNKRPFTRPETHLFPSIRLILCAAAALLAQTLITGCSPITFTIGGPPDEPGIHATTVHQDPAGHTFNQIAVIDITGLIVNSSLPGVLTSHENPVGRLHESLDKARLDDNVKAVILRLNTPGGTVTASDAMYREVRRFKQLSQKPVVTAMQDVTASGGYYLACATDHIVAYPTTITASIGVIFQTISFKGAMDRFGVHAEAITSGPNKEAGSPLAEMTDSHRAVLRSMVDDMYTRFTNVVRNARPNIPADQFDTITDGRVVTGEQALKLGLVDENGDIYTAWAAAKKLADIEKSDLVFYHRDGLIIGSAYAAAPSNQPNGSTQINLAQFNMDAMNLGGAEMSFMYLWQPMVGP